MVALPTQLNKTTLTILVHQEQDLVNRLPALDAFARRGSLVPLSRQPQWLKVLEQGLRHVPYCLEALDGTETQGILPLAYVQSLFFGRFLVSLPYLNQGGVLAENEETGRLLINQAVVLADQLRVRYLELRHERPLAHVDLGHQANEKVQMRLPLPTTPGILWDKLDGKVRNQVRKGEKNSLTVSWGREEFLEDFYSVFAQNMRDLGTPVYGKPLFQSVLHFFGEQAEICLVRAESQTVAAALLLHGQGVTEVPSASSLRQFNHTNANMLMYWNLLRRAAERGQQMFDFGRSSVGGNTFRFKKQWGAEPCPTAWQYYLRSGEKEDMRPDNPRYRMMIRLWKKIPVGLTRLLGPAIVRGIP